MFAPDENIARALLHAEQRDPDEPALRSGTEVITHGELDAAILAASALLASHGVAPGDRVGLIVPNVPQFAVLYYAVLAAGAVAVPISPLLSAPEARFCLNDAGARLALLGPHAHGPGLPELKPSAQVLEVGTESLRPLGPGERLDVEVVPRSGDDTAVIIYTSGTTGRPKGARLTHRNLLRNADAIVEAAGISATTVALGALPLSHSFGQSWLLNAGTGDHRRAPDHVLRGRADDVRKDAGGAEADRHHLAAAVRVGRRGNGARADGRLRSDVRL